MQIKSRILRYDCTASFCFSFIAGGGTAPLTLLPDSRGIGTFLESLISLTSRILIARAVYGFI